jgi:hypothetical protein
VSKQIVERLEVVDIEHEQRERLSTPCGALQFALQRNLKEMAIEEIRQPIPNRLILKLGTQVEARNRHRRQLHHLVDQRLPPCGQRLHRVRG